MHSRSIILRLALGATLCAGTLAGQESAPYRDPRLPVADRVRDLLGRMTPEEKFWQLYMTPGDLSDTTDDYSHGVFGLQIPTARLRGTPAALARADALHIDSIQRFFVERTRLDIPIVPFDEAVHGLVRDGATVFPQAIALAATWDTSLVGHVAAAIAAESATRGIHQVLSPVLNLARDVRWGRVEETYGEDPFLAAAMGRAFIGPFEAANVATTPKHFVANVGEGGRDSYPIEWDERELEDRPDEKGRGKEQRGDQQLDPRVEPVVDRGPLPEYEPPTQPHHARSATFLPQGGPRTGPGACP